MRAARRLPISPALSARRGLSPCVTGTPALLHLEDRVVVVDEETALGNMGFKRRGAGKCCGFSAAAERSGCFARKHPFRQPAYRVLQLHGQVAMGKEAVAGLTGIEAS